MNQPHYGPQVPACDEVHANKYRAHEEPFREAMGRVAAPLTNGEEEYDALREIMLNMRFMAGGRIQAAVGAPKRVTPYNCFVSGTIGDSFVDGHDSIMARATEAATTMRMGGGIGYDFSTLRPRGAHIKKLGSKSSGPVSFMEIFDAVCKCVASSGHRRGAQMGVLRVDHPDIEEFVRAKHNKDRLNGFNVSVGITDEFMRAVRADGQFELRWGGEVWDTVDARALWELIMRSTYDWAEPGVLFIDRINGMNNLKYCETIVATNPCGEQPLPPYGACLLGSFNLTRYIQWTGDNDHAPEQGGWQFMWHQFIADIPRVVAAMDRVIDVATYPLHEQEQEAHNKRRMGLGITGLANAGEVLGFPYGSDEFIAFEERVMRTLTNECYRASALLAEERGAFPLFSKAQYMESPFVKQLDADVQELMRLHGMRNSHLTSIAPTGTISLAADNVSSGIEPVFALTQKRTIDSFEGKATYDFEDYGYRVWGVKGRTSEQVTLEEHLAVLAMAQRWTDSSVSKTCNVPSDITWEDFKAVYMHAWELGCKGITTYRPGGKREAILVKGDDLPDEEELVLETAEGSACYVDPLTGRHECE